MVGLVLPLQMDEVGVAPLRPPHLSVIRFDINDLPLHTLLCRSVLEVHEVADIPPEFNEELVELNFLRGSHRCFGRC